MWKYDITSKGNVFAPINVYQSESCAYIYIACHDKNVYCLEYTFSDDCYKLCWKFTGHAPFNAGPVVIFNRSLVIVSNDGRISIINRFTGALQYEFAVSGQVFATPAFHENSSQLLISCRDNFMYAFKLNDEIHL